MTNSKTDVRFTASFLVILILLIILNCSTSTDRSNPSAGNKSKEAIGYNLSAPDKVILLPGILREISGITLIDSSSVACVQDENGIVFIFDLEKNKIKDQFPFYSNGDYEGITSVNNTLYVLRSDGVLFEILNSGTSGAAKKIFTLGIQAKENEGLCYDKKANRLLIAPKVRSGRTSEYNGKHPIYGFDLNSEILVKEPVFDFDMAAIEKFASDNKIVLPVSGKNKAHKANPGIRFRPSAIGIHPLTNKLFVLSGVEQMLFVFNMNGTIEFIEKFNPEILDMPEGITFFENGDMLISNEGKNRYPALVRFNYNPQKTALADQGSTR